MDALRVCKRLGAETVKCVYRRTRAESPARADLLQPGIKKEIAVYIGADSQRFKVPAVVAIVLEREL